MRRDCVLYCNNRGDRWIVLDHDGRREKRTWLTKSGMEVTRRVIYYYSFGNFGGALISYKGKLLKVLTDSILED